MLYALEDFGNKFQFGNSEVPVLSYGWSLRFTILLARLVSTKIAPR